MLNMSSAAPLKPEADVLSQYWKLLNQKWQPDVIRKQQLEVKMMSSGSRSLKSCLQRIFV